jgi:amidase
VSSIVADELWRLGAGQLADLISRREVTSREVIEAHLGRIDEVNGSVCAVTVTLAESALAAADQADERMAAGSSLGALDGVPFSVKENIDVQGSATTQGVIALERAVAEIDSPPVGQLRRAGGIPFARTNTSDFALRWHADNALRGPTINPWDSSRSPGGSSGGEAAAVATGMSPLGVGNDYGGSLRIPAQFCGVCALRPTLGRVAYATAFQPEDFPITRQLMMVQGPVARHVSDLRLALDQMCGEDPRDPWWTPAPLSGPPLAKRVAVWRKADDRNVELGVDSAAAALLDAGYEVEDAQPPQVDEAVQLFVRLISADIRWRMTALRPMLGPGTLRFVETLIELNPDVDRDGYMEGLMARQGVARAWSRFQARTPLILGPVSTQQPFAVGRDLEGPSAVAEIIESFRLCVTVNLLGLPAAAVPVAVNSGLPQGVQLIGPRYREDHVLDAAQEIEDRLGVITPVEQI